jgi:succinoglycan biosynthesis protein ExoV
MHGAIVADALGIPWQRVSIFNRKITQGKIVDFKWEDWGASLGVDTTPAFEKLLPYPGRTPLRRVIKAPYCMWAIKDAANEIRRVIKRGVYKISNRAILNSKVNQMKDRIENIKTGYFL